MKHEWRLQTVRENFNQNEGEETLREYTEREAKSDPRFFNWFFGSEATNIDDFGNGMTAEQKEEYREFLELL